MGKDKLIRGVLKGGNIRFFMVRTTKMANEITSRHQTTPVASAALARLVSVATIMAAMQKNGRISVIVKGDGPLGLLIVDGTYDLKMRGFIEHPHIDLPLKNNGKLDVGAAVGHQGLIHVVRDQGLKQNFESQVALVSGELGEDFSYYFQESEQIPSVVALGALIDVDYKVKSAGAIVLQLMPNAQEEDYLEAEAYASKLTNVSAMFDNNLDVLEIANNLFPNLEFIEAQVPIFQCNCNKEKLLNSLGSIPLEELEEMAEKTTSTEVICDFCNTHYYFEQADIKEVLSRYKKEKLSKEG